MDCRSTLTRREVLAGGLSATVASLSGVPGSAAPLPADQEPGPAAGGGRMKSFLFSNRNRALPGSFNYSGNNGYRTVMAYAGQLIGTVAGPRINERGMHLEPAATNLLINSRLRGGAASGNGTFGVPVTVTATAVQNTNLVVVHHPAHGYSAGDRVHCTGAPPAGIALRNRPENAYNIARIIDADSYEIAHSRISSVSGTSAPFAMVRAPAPVQTLPNGWAKKGEAPSRRFLLRTSADNGWSSSTGARREIQVSGTGVDYLYLSPDIAVNEGEPLCFSLPIYGFGHAFAPDSFQLINLTLELVLEWRDPTSEIVGETAASLNDQCGSYVYQNARVSGLAPRTGFARVAIKASGTVSSDCGFFIFEPMVSKTSWAPLVVLPPPGTSARASVAADRIAPYSHDADIRTVAVAFDMQEIVNEIDGLLAVGGIEIKVVGAQFPRDIVVTDGTNSVRLTSAIDRRYKTQGYHRLAVTWGDFGVRLAHVDGPVVARTAMNEVFNASAASRLVKIGRLANDSGVSAIVLKELDLSDAPLGLADLATLATPLRFFARNKRLPLRDLAAGRTSTRPLKVPGVDPAPGAGLAWRVLGPRIAVTAAAKDLTVSDWDFRGFYITPAETVTNVAFEHCLFDDSASAGGNCIDTFGRSSGWAARNCTFSAQPHPGTRFSTWINSQTEAFVVERCAFFGSQSDIGSGGGMTFRENYVRAGRTALAAHPDNWQFLLGRGPVLLERNIIDLRMGYGEKAPQNSAIGGSTGLSPVRHAIKFADNMVFGGHNQVAFNQASTYPIADGEPRWWRSDAKPAAGETSILVVRNNFLSMSTANVITNNVGNCIRIVCPGPIVLEGTAFEKLGLSPGTYDNVVTGHSIVSPGNMPLKSSFRLLGPTPSLGTRAVNGGIASGESLTVNGRTIVVVATDAAGDTQIEQGDTIATLAAKIAALVPGAFLAVVPYSIEIRDNFDPLMGLAL